MTRRGDLFFWATGPADVEQWPVVVTDFEYSHWRTFDGNVCAFLTELVSGNFDATGFEVDLSAQEPHCELSPPLLPPEPAQSAENFWAGTFGDILIASPGASAPFDLYAILEERRRKQDTPREEVDPPVHPESGGMIAWGKTPDGWTAIGRRPAKTPMSGGDRHCRPRDGRLAVSVG